MAVEGLDDWLQRRADPATNCSRCGPSAGLGSTIIRVLGPQDASGK